MQKRSRNSVQTTGKVGKLHGSTVIFRDVQRSSEKFPALQRNFSKEQFPESSYKFLEIKGSFVKLAGVLQSLRNFS